METLPQHDQNGPEPQPNTPSPAPLHSLLNGAVALAFLQFLFAGLRAGFLAVTAFPGPRTDFFDLSQSGALERAAEHGIALAGAADVYLGVGVQGSRPASGRGKADTVIAIPGLWLDLDIAHEKAHAEKDLPKDEAAALEILSDFGKPPTITVRTGHGLHSYRLFNEPWVRTGDGWLDQARLHEEHLQTILKAATEKRGFKLDNTADLARILRLPGTSNRKVTDDVVPVTWDETGPRYDLRELIDHIGKKYRELAPSPNRSLAGSWRGVFEDGELGSDGFEGFVQQRQSNFQPKSPLGLQSDFPPADFDAIAERCPWVRYCRDHAHELNEPDWYAFLGVVGRCQNGRQLAHKFSAPYPAYSETETEKKLAHALTAAGPATCQYITVKLGHSALCAACSEQPRVKSPIVLGKAWSKPKPLSATLPPVNAFDADLLPHALRPWVADLAERLQVPMDFPGATALVALGAATGRRAYITPLRHDSTWRVIPNLWGGIVGRSGMMKSPVIRAILAPLRAMQELAMAEHQAAFEQYQRELDGWELRKKVHQKDEMKKTGGYAGFEEAKPEPPPCVRFLVNDATVEKFHAILKDNPQGVLLIRDELSGWFAALDTKGRERDRPFFLEAWNGDGSYAIDRIGRGTLYVPHLCISVFGGIQPAKLQTYLLGAVTGGSSDDGLAQRLQVLVYPDQPTEWEQIDRPPTPWRKGSRRTSFRAS